MKEQPSLLIKPQQNEEERQEWIKNNPDKYTRLSGPGEGLEIRGTYDLLREEVETISAKPFNQNVLFNNAESRSNRVLIYRQIEKNIVMTMKQLVKTTSLSEETIRAHIKQLKNIIKSKQGNTCYYSIDKGEKTV